MSSGQSRERRVPAPVTRMVSALNDAGFTPDHCVLIGFGTAHGSLAAWTLEALNQLGAVARTPEDLLGDPEATVDGFIGAPDQLFALCESGFGHVLKRALLGGGVVLPLVREVAEAQSIALCDILTDPIFGPYAVRLEGSAWYGALDAVEISIVRPGCEAVMPTGMIGEVRVREALSSQAWRSTGLLSAFEKRALSGRQHRLVGWRGVVAPQARVQDIAVDHAVLADLLSKHGELHDARLLVPSDDAPDAVLQVETEAGAWIDEPVADTFHKLTGLSPRLERIVPGQFHNDGRAFRLQAA